MSYHQKKHTCLHCGGNSRGVTFYALMGGYYHYECWLELGRQNTVDAMRKHSVQIIPSEVPDKSVPAPALDTRIADRWNEEHRAAGERRRVIQARLEGF